MGRIHPPVSIVKQGVVCTFVEDGDGGSANFVREHFCNWESDTFQVFDELCDTSKVAIDLGAWIGTTCIWLSRHFKSVVAVEADPLACAALVRNLVASECRNVLVVSQPIAREHTKVLFGPHPNGGHLNDSTSQIKDTASSIDDVVMESVTLDDLTSAYDPHEIGLIKVDIEGGEESIIEDLIQFGCKNPDCRVYVSFHVTWWKNQNLNRLESLFALAHVTNRSAGFLQAPITFLRDHPFESLLFAFH